MAKTNGKLIANNKKAYHDYFILDTYEAGIALHGTEVKSLRMGKCSIKESFIRVENGETVSYTHLRSTTVAIKLTSLRATVHPLQAPSGCSEYARLKYLSQILQ